LKLQFNFHIFHEEGDLSKFFTLSTVTGSCDLQSEFDSRYVTTKRIQLRGTLMRFQ